GGRAADQTQADGIQRNFAHAGRLGSRHDAAANARLDRLSPKTSMKNYLKKRNRRWTPINADSEGQSQFIQQATGARFPSRLHLCSSEFIGGLKIIQFCFSRSRHKSSPVDLTPSRKNSLPSA